MNPFKFLLWSSIMIHIPFDVRDSLFCFILSFHLGEVSFRVSMLKLVDLCLHNVVHLSSDGSNVDLHDQVICIHTAPNRGGYSKAIT